MKTKRTQTIGMMLVAVGMFTFAALRCSAQTEALTPPLKCEEVRFSVALSAGEPANYQVVGWLCRKHGPRPQTVQVLLSGATYGHIYWDFPLRPEQYSYVQALTVTGYATFNLDRIGIGGSDHPSQELVTVESNAFVVHQIVQALRDGRLGSFSKIILVGHSIGSAIAQVEAATYADVDAIVITAFLHTFGPSFFAVPAAFYPAENDPRFANQNLPSGYLTTVPGVRGTLFYWGPSAEADVIALDEATKETITIGEATSLLQFFGGNAARNIRVPVLIAVGQYDMVWCTPPACPEAQVEPVYYAPDADLEIHVIPNAGHDLNLDLNSSVWFALVRDWSQRHFGG